MEIPFYKSKYVSQVMILMSKTTSADYFVRPSVRRRA